MQTHAQAAYLAGAIVCEIEARGYAGADGFSPAAMGNISRWVAKMPVYARHCWAKAATDPVISQMMGEFDPPENSTPTAEQSCFWVGYYHQKIARELPADLPAKLSALRTAAGLSVPDLARASGLSDDVLRQYESGARRPTWDSVQKLATAMGVPTDAFRETRSE